MKFSIITPAFNETERIEKCIESVINQSFKDFEMVVIDDGSVDDTAAKVDSYSQIDKRIQLIRMRQNMGLTAAKNAALEKVKGEYLVFVDADDWILPCMLSDLAEQLSIYDNIDMFRLKGRKVYTRSLEPKPHPNYETRLYTPVDLIRERKMSGFMHNLVVKNKLVQKHNIRFSPGRIMLEDQEFSVTCMVYSKNVLYFTKQNYMYYQRSGSLSHNVKTEQLPDIMNCSLSVYRHAKNNLSEKDLQPFIEYTLAKCDQFIKEAFRDTNFKQEEVKYHLSRFFKTIDLSFSQRLFQTSKMQAVRAAKLMGI